MAEGRDAKGRFIKGHKFAVGGGRPSNEERANLRAIIDAHVSGEAEEAAWKRIEVAMLLGGRGWIDLFKLYLEYRYGKPMQAVDMAVHAPEDEDLTDGERAALERYLGRTASGAEGTETGG